MPKPGAVRSVAGIVFAGSQATTWNLDDGRLVLEPIPRLRFSSFLMIRDAAIAGGQLVQWGTVSGVEVALWVLHTSRRLTAPKVRAFVEIMCLRYPDVSLVLKG